MRINGHFAEYQWIYSLEFEFEYFLLYKFIHFFRRKSRPRAIMLMLYAEIDHVGINSHHIDYHIIKKEQMYAIHITHQCIMDGCTVGIIQCQMYASTHTEH